MFIYCPKCSSVANVPIAYGKPGHEAIEAHKHGLIYLAGCVIENESIDRHCKACGYEWASTGDHKKMLTRMLDELEHRLADNRNELERACIEMGRRVDGKDCFALNTVFMSMREYHSAWHQFTSGLKAFGSEVLIRNENGLVQARYRTTDAAIIIDKELFRIYGDLGWLADGCHKLGVASLRGSVDGLKIATHEIQLARQALDENWQRLRRMALNGGG
jgi:hypothetical protein